MNFLEAIIHPKMGMRTEKRHEPKTRKLMDEDLRGGVQLEDWTKADQERLLRGELPKGVPIHRNV